MATLEEVYAAVMSSDEERAAFFEASKTAGGLSSFLADKGCEATPEQVAEFVKEKAGGAGELADEELDNVAGGGCGFNDGEFTGGKACPSCGSTDCAFTNERVFQGCVTYDAHCNACGYNFTYVVS